MEYRVRSGQFVTIRLPEEITLGAGAAALLVAYARHRLGRVPWALTAVDAFSSGGETLLIARPAEITGAFFPDYALPFLYKYFTE